MLVLVGDFVGCVVDVAGDEECCDVHVWVFGGEDLGERVHAGFVE